MTKAFKQGFMDMMRKIAAEDPRAGVVKKDNKTGTPADAVYDRPRAAKNLADGANIAVNGYLGQNQGIHTPIQASQIAANFLATNPDIAAAPHLPPIAGNLLLQRGIDALPDPGPGVRQPTPYEAAEYFRTLIDMFSKPDTAASAEGSLRGGFNPLFNLLPGFSREQTTTDQDQYLDDLTGSDIGISAGLSMLRADPKLQDEFARRAWNTATSAVPISVTSAGRETP